MISIDFNHIGFIIKSCFMQTIKSLEFFFLSKFIVDFLFNISLIFIICWMHISIVTRADSFFPAIRYPFARSSNAEGEENWQIAER